MTKQTHKEDAQDLEMRRYHEFKELCGGSANIAREMAILAEQVYSAAALADAEQKLRNVWKCAFAESQEELAAAQATIAEMRAAVQAIHKDYDKRDNGTVSMGVLLDAARIIALPTNQDALHEARAQALEEAVVNWSYGLGGHREEIELKAAAHRTKKGEGK